MLKGIPSILPPDLLKAMMEMGHGDELLLADGNYPKFGCPENVIRCDGHSIPELLDAILKFMPLDPYVENPSVFMAVVPGDPYTPTIWEKYREIGKKYEEKGLREITVEKPEFYERGRHVYAAVATGETELYANLIIRKGVVME